MATLADVVNASVSEREFARTVCHLAKLNGWALYHTWLSIRSQPGFPDVIAVRDGRLLAIELKRESGKVTPDQARWLDLLGACPCVEVKTWRPSMWNEIVEVLAR